MPLEVGVVRHDGAAGQGRGDRFGQLFDGGGIGHVLSRQTRQALNGERKLAAGTQQTLQRRDRFRTRVDQRGAELEDLRGRIVGEPGRLQVDDRQGPRGPDEALQSIEVHAQLLGRLPLDLQGGQGATHGLLGWVGRRSQRDCISCFDSSGDGRVPDSGGRLGRPS